MPDNSQQDQLVASFKNRAMLYRHFFEALSRRLGEAEAAEVMKEAIYARGLEIGRHFTHVAPDDMEGIKEAFLAFVPGPDGSLFAPELVRCDADGVDIKFHRCPLKEAWQEAGLPAEEIARLCHIAGRVDNGTFEGAGFAFSADTWQPGEEGCCFLHIRPGPARK